MAKKRYKKAPRLSLKDISLLLRGRSLRQLVIQFTDRCNALCPQCGMRVSRKFDRSVLDVESVKNIIGRFAEQGGRALSLTGGEPFLYFDQIIELIRYAGVRKIPFIRTGTNGFLFRNSEKADYIDHVKRIAGKLAETNLKTLWISIDSADPGTHERMRGLPGVIKGIEKALPVFHEFGIYPSANLGINRNTGGTASLISLEIPSDERNGELFYEQAVFSFKKFYRFVIELGFTIVNACYPMSDDHNAASELDAVYGASSGDSIITFNSGEKVLLYRALFDTIPEFRSLIRIFTPRVSLYSLIKQYSGAAEDTYPCLGGIYFFFIDAVSGQVYPCGYRGSESMGDFMDLDIDSIDTRPFCRQCDWECFRDPSELLGPVMEIGHPLRLAGRIIRDKKFARLWSEDLQYYRASDFFNGRKEADYGRLKQFGRPSPADPGIQAVASTSR